MIRIDSLARSVRYRLSLLLGAVAIVVLLMSTVARALGAHSTLLSRLALSLRWPTSGVCPRLAVLSPSSYDGCICSPGAGTCAGGLGCGPGITRPRSGAVLARSAESELQEPRGTALVEVTALNTAMHTLGILAAGQVFIWVGGVLPLSYAYLPDVARLALAGITYLGINYLLAWGYFATRGSGALKAFKHSLPKILLYEGLPMVFSPLATLVATRLGQVISCSISLDS